jgi:hypothetical protein
MKLIRKKRIDGKTIKTYDTAQTSYQWVLAHDQISIEVKAKLIQQYVQLNPVQLRQELDRKVAQLWKISK